MAPARTSPHQRRQRHASSSASPAPKANADLPPISALFLIDFDVKAGYTITWKRAVPGVELDGRVEYKSLPSGLHTVKEDLVYFVHEGTHAGLSAFVNVPCEEEGARNARMIAVGILVPLSYGRLGRAWRHAEELKSLAEKLGKDRSQTQFLEKYWEAHRAIDANGQSTNLSATDLPASPTQDRKPHKRNRSASDGAALAPVEHKLSPFHPAWSLTKLLDTFGPLIFPIQRAALLRKRILISCHAPVHEICDFVYNISILSNIPFSVADTLPPSSLTPRLRPLFTIGVHDIPFLTDDFEAFKRRQEDSADLDDESGTGWVACTTDSILAMKDTLWDMLITMPAEQSADSKIKAWPTVEYPRGTAVKATQRDFRRFNALRNGLTRLVAQPEAEDGPDAYPQSPVRLSSSHSHRLVKDDGQDGVDTLVEPTSWAALAYGGFMWWASAGEQLRAEEQEESSRDASLLADLSAGPPTPMTATPGQPEFMSESLASLSAQRQGNDTEARMELAIIAYFHRLTTQMLSMLVEVVDSADAEYVGEYRDSEDGDDQGEDEQLLNRDDSDDMDGPVTIDSRTIEIMGLDVWSSTDAAFVVDLMATYFGRTARIEGKGVEVCGVRVC